MNRWVRWTITTAVFLALLILIASLLLERSARRAATENGAVRDFHNVKADELDRIVRNQVPLESTQAFVEEFLKREGMRFSFDSPSRTILANAPFLKGSGFVVYESLGFKFQFDNDSKLTSIASTVKLTGP